MDQQQRSAPACAQNAPPPRRLIAAGVIRQAAGRRYETTRTAAGITGRITAARIGGAA